MIALIKVIHGPIRNAFWSKSSRGRRPFPYLAQFVVRGGPISRAALVGLLGLLCLVGLFGVLCLISLLCLPGLLGLLGWLAVFGLLCSHCLLSLLGSLGL